MRTRKYLLDENISPKLRKALNRDYPEMVVWRVGDPSVPQLNTPDPEILLWCEAKGFSLVTNNRTSMPVHLRDHLAAGRHVPGIFVLSRKMSMGEIIEELALIWEATYPDEYADLINFLPVSG
jgi:hypothetical protein